WHKAQTATDTVQESGYVVDFTGIPLGGDEIDDGGFNLLQGIAGFADQRFAGLSEFTGAHVDGGGFLGRTGGLLRAPLAVETGQTGFYVKQGAGNVHQGAVVDHFGLLAELFYQFNLFGDDLSGDAKTENGEGVGNLAQAWQQLVQFAVLAKFGPYKQVEL